MLIDLEMTVQQVALGGIGVAEQHHLGVQSLDPLQGAVAQCEAVDHRRLTTPGRDA
ncbi:hypothetical protein D3C78_1686920 [compost metagenome]